MARKNQADSKLSFTSSDFDPLLALYSTELASKCRGAKVFDNLAQYINGLRQSESFKSIGWFPDEFGIGPRSRGGTHQEKEKLKRKAGAFLNIAEQNDKDYCFKSQDVDVQFLQKQKHVKLSCKSSTHKDTESWSSSDASFKDLFESEQSDCNNLDVNIYGELQNLPKFSAPAPNDSSQYKNALSSTGDEINKKCLSTIQDKLVKISESKVSGHDTKSLSGTKDRSARLKSIMLGRDEEQEKKTLNIRKRSNVLQKMEVHKEGPLSILYNCMKRGIRLKVWTRRYKGLRGVCIGYLVAFDKHMNLAMIDVDEVYTLEIRTLSVQEQTEIAKGKKLEKRSRNRLNRIHKSCEMIQDKENRVKGIDLENKQEIQGSQLAVTDGPEFCKSNVQPRPLSNNLCRKTKKEIEDSKGLEKIILQNEIADKKKQNVVSTISEQSHVEACHGDDEFLKTASENGALKCSLNDSKQDNAGCAAGQALTRTACLERGQFNDDLKQPFKVHLEVNSTNITNNVSINEVYEASDNQAVKSEENLQKKQLSTSKINEKNVSRVDRKQITSPAHSTILNDAKSESDFDISASSEEETTATCVLEKRVSDSDEEDTRQQIPYCLTGVQTVSALSSTVADEVKSEDSSDQTNSANKITTETYRCDFSLFTSKINPQKMADDSKMFPESASFGRRNSNPETFALTGNYAGFDTGEKSDNEKAKLTLTSNKNVSYSIVKLDISRRESYSEMENPIFTSGSEQKVNLRDPRQLKMKNKAVHLRDEAIANTNNHRPSDPRRPRLECLNTSTDKNKTEMPDAMKLNQEYHRRNQPSMTEKDDASCMKKLFDPRIGQKVYRASDNVETGTVLFQDYSDKKDSKASGEIKTQIDIEIESTGKEIDHGMSLSENPFGSNSLPGLDNIVCEKEKQTSTSEKENEAFQTEDCYPYISSKMDYDTKSELLADKKLSKQHKLDIAGTLPDHTINSVMEKNKSQFFYTTSEKECEDSTCTKLENCTAPLDVQRESSIESEQLTKSFEHTKKSQSENKTSNGTENTHDNALTKFFQRRIHLNTAKTGTEKANTLLKGKEDIRNKICNNQQKLNKQSINQQPRSLSHVSAVFDSNKSLPGHVFRQRHVNQLFIRGDNVALIAYNKPN